MEYQVPQFIEVEDKIFGPLTLKQFIYLAGSVGICALTFFTLPIYLFAIISIPVAGLGLALAFYRMNNKPFIEIMEAAFYYAISKRLYLWRHDTSEHAAPAPIPNPAMVEAQRQKLPDVSQSKLRDLAWSLDINEKKF